MLRRVGSRKSSPSWVASDEGSSNAEGSEHTAWIRASVVGVGEREGTWGVGGGSVLARGGGGLLGGATAVGEDGPKVGMATG